MLFKYKYIIVPFISLIICQIIKFTIESIQHKELKWDRLFNGAGGMPSTHTTFSFALTTLVYYYEGIDSALFGACLIFSLIISYDAIGVRYESGKQAEAINDLVDELSKKKKKNFKELKEQLGHEPLQVMVGFILGVLVSTIYTMLV